jgi:TrmH family RNA methyltransferase
MTPISSRSNPRVRRWRALAREAAARREEGCALLEGGNLVAACQSSGGEIRSLILSRSALERPEFADVLRHYGKAPTVLTDPVFRAIADTESPAGIAAEIALPRAKPDLATAASCVVLEEVQDAGNVGTLLRSAAAFGIRVAVLGPGCADAWSPKVLRAGMGAHFSIGIAENADLPAALKRFGGAAVCTAPRGGTPLAEANLPSRIAWIFGAEGRGVSKALAAKATHTVSIPMKGLAESLNVAAAAAICFYEASRRTS